MNKHTLFIKVQAYYADLTYSTQQTPESFRQRSIASKALSYACNLAAPWL